MLNSLLPLLPPVQNCLVVLRASEETVRGEPVWSCLPLFNAVPLGYLNMGKKVRIARFCGVEYASAAFRQTVFKDGY
jgi:hypothetical protein